MLRLSELIQPYSDHKITEDCDVSDVVVDSRDVTDKCVFIDLANNPVHCEEALAKGALAVIVEQGSNLLTVIQAKSPIIPIKNLAKQAIQICKKCYQNPLDSLTVIGTTGTNGKTTVSQLIAQVFSQCGLACGVLGTAGWGIWPDLTPSLLTTPDQYSLQKQFARLRDQQQSHVAMEVSSHGLAQNRVEGIEFDTAVFTNLTQDHLDYHKNFSAYGAAKLKLFQQTQLPKAVINHQDPYSNTILNILTAATEVILYGLNKSESKHAQFYVAELEGDRSGSRAILYTPQGKQDLFLPLLGRFNIENALAALAVAYGCGIELSDAVAALTQVKGVPGRMQAFHSTSHPSVVVDYAHTPDALANALRALRSHTQGRVWCVFGCGGDRDQDKRSKMGRVADQLADCCVLTNDNPRSEDPNLIIEQIITGMSKIPEQCLPDRHEAIVYALSQASPEDVVLIAGKGHEDYQIIGQQRLSFSDIEVVTQLLGR